MIHKMECKLHSDFHDSPECIIINDPISKHKFCLNNFDNDFDLNDIINIRNFLNKIIMHGTLPTNQNELNFIDNNDDGD